MKRLALLLAVVPVVTPAVAWEVATDTAMGCRPHEYHERIFKLAAAGDTAAVEKLIRTGLLSGNCKRWDKGMAVRVEQRSSPFVCVAPLGSTEDCWWAEGSSIKQ